MKKIVILSEIALLCACSMSNSNPQPKYVIETPYGYEEMYEGMVTPDVYAMVATRATNRMLDQTKKNFEKNPAPKLYIMEIQKIDETMPDGFFYAQEVTEKIIEGSRTFTRVNNMNDADYFLEIQVREILLTPQDTPIIEYTMVLWDRNNVRINEWVETIRQIKNDDKSWW